MKRMMAILLTGLFAILAEASHAGEPVGGPPRDKRWRLVFDDEFDGNKLDLSKWTRSRSSLARAVSSAIMRTPRGRTSSPWITCGLIGLSEPLPLLVRGRSMPSRPYEGRPQVVHGSVLVRDGAVYCAAGRSSYLDGGIRLLRLDLKTGRRQAEQRLWSREPRTGDQPEEPRMFEMPGASPDVLSCDGRFVYMRHLAFDPQDLTPHKAPAHLYSPAGFLDDSWWHRTFWLFGEHFYSGYLGWYFAGRETPAGRLLVMDDRTICGFGYRPEFYRTATDARYHLFAIDRRSLRVSLPALMGAAGSSSTRTFHGSYQATARSRESSG